VLKRAKVHVENVGGKVWGVVLNDVKTEIAGYSYTQYYTHYYGEDTVVDPHKDRLQRARGLVRNLFNRWPRAEALAGEPAGGAPSALTGAGFASEALEPSAEPSPFDMPAVGASRSKRLLMGAVGLALLAALGGLAAWRLGWFGGSERPREILRQRLEAPPPTPTPAVSHAVATPPTPAVKTPEPLAPALGAGPLVAPPAVERPASTVSTTPPLRPAPQPVAPAAATRFAIEFGPFMTAAEAERVERQLNEAGYPTVRFRQQTGGSLYAVLVEKIPSSREAQALVASLREQGFAEAFVVGEREPLTVQVGLPLPLRGAVQAAERLRASGHQVRVAAQPGEAVVFALRHGNFATSGEAEAKGQELMRLGLGNQVVRVK